MLKFTLSTGEIFDVWGNLMKTWFPQHWGNLNSKLLFYFIFNVFDAIITWLVLHRVSKQSNKIFLKSRTHHYLHVWHLITTFKTYIGHLGIPNSLQGLQTVQHQTFWALQTTFALSKLIDLSSCSKREVADREKLTPLMVLSLM